MSKDTGGSAFPYLFFAHPTEETFVSKGMTLRDYFAAKVMQAFESRNELDDVPLMDIANRSYRIADAMLKARKQ